MATIDEIFKSRLKKRKILKERRENPYPVFVKKTHETSDLLDNFDKLSKSEAVVATAGRLMSLRTHGGVSFSDLKDSSGSIQVAFRKDSVGRDTYSRVGDFLDVGDFLEVEGVMFKTKKGEKTLDIRKFRIISKSLKPLPEKWHGLKDVEQRYRKRYLDLLMNDNVKNIFEVRSKIVSELRYFLDKEGFMEVETPILQPIPGGASANPFETHLNAFKMDMYLRIAPELYLKRLLVGGLDRVYEIGRTFRNEGVDYAHNPEFTILEFYWAYSDYKEGMKFIENMISNVVKKVVGKKKIKYSMRGKDEDSQEIDFSTPWARVEFNEVLQKYAGVNYEDYDMNSLKKKAEELGVKIEKKVYSKAEIADIIYKKSCQSKLINPTFVIHQPIEMLPLAKPLEDRPGLAASIQLIVAGWEMIKAYSELNDPIVQREFFEEQEKLRKKGDKEAQYLDEDFLEALEHGMPPALGFGMGIDRLTALLTNSHSLREVILFPTMRSKE